MTPNHNAADNNDEKPIHLRLFDFSEDEIKSFNHYQILGLEEPVRATPYTIKQAYRKASIRYHPDKTGRDESDYVFIAVKSAWDTLSDVAKRQAYDSTEMPFDDSIPPDVSNSANSSGFLYTDDDFYETFGPVFERNLRFDTRLQEQTSKNKNAEIPSLGVAGTPIEEVQAFYNYWIHFQSWRDFSQKAQEELFDNNNPLEDAESRYEKRFYQKEIDKRSKQLKKQEMNRIQTLVERAMAADPRLQRHYKAQKEAKELAAKERQRRKEEEAKRKKEEEERKRHEETTRVAQEKEQRSQEKAAREKEKKQLRKVKQQFRKITVAEYQKQADNSIFKSLEAMSDEVEFLCSELNLLQIQQVTQEFQNDFGIIQQWVIRTRQSKDQAAADAKQEAQALQYQMEEKQRKRAEEIAQAKIWSQLELSALAKAVKKFPGGGANRWESIASYINNNCRPETPKTREECIEKYNQIAKGGGGAGPTGTSNEPTQVNGIKKKKSHGQEASGIIENAVPNNPKAMNKTESAMTETSTASTEADVWTDEQDQLLQDALAKFPVSMEKNERWTSIAKMVKGKSKKQCVQRFKSIRDAIKNNKQNHN